MSRIYNVRLSPPPKPQLRTIEEVTLTLTRDEALYLLVQLGKGSQREAGVETEGSQTVFEQLYDLFHDHEGFAHVARKKEIEASLASWLRKGP